MLESVNLNVHIGKVPFETAIDRAGFGLYSYTLIALTGLVTISNAFVLASGSIIAPTSTCDLGTTSAQQGLLVAVPLIGSLFGGPVWGFLGDRNGRRKMLLVSLLCGATTKAISSISVHWAMLLALQFLAVVFASGQSSLSMTLLSESVPMVRRNMVVLVVSSFLMLSLGIMSLVAIPVIPLGFSIYLPALGIYWNSWRTLILVYSLPGIIAAICLLFMKESPKYVLAKGDKAEALEILRTIHRINNRNSKEELLKYSGYGTYQHIMRKVTGLLEESPASGSASVKDQIVPIFKPPLIKYTAIMASLFIFLQTSAFQLWLPSIANQFVTILRTGEGYDLTLCGIIGLSNDAPPDPDVAPCSINATAFLTVFAVAAMQSLLNGLVSLFVNRIGCRNLVMILTLVCGASGIILNVVPNAIASAVLFAVFLQGLIAMGLYIAIMVALFPTHLRALAMALAPAAGGVMNFAVVQIVNLMLIDNCEAAFYIVASIFAASAIVVSFLPDDRLLGKLQTPQQTKEVTPE